MEPAYVGAYFGAAYRGSVPETFGLKGKSAAEQLVALARTLPYSGFDVACEIAERGSILLCRSG